MTTAPSPFEQGSLEEQIERANASGHTPVVFIHGLWLLASSWDRWAEHFAEAGYAPVSPGWPDDPDTVEEALANPEVFADKTIGQVAEHYSNVIGRLSNKPAVIGHSFGGLLAQIVAGRGLAAVTVAIDPAPFRGIPMGWRLVDCSFGLLGAVPLLLARQATAPLIPLPTGEVRATRFLP